MTLRPTVFDSAAERAVFKALEGQWGDELRLYPQLPLSKLFSGPPTESTPQERSFFYKANVDYTLCDVQDRPIVSVEFDGIGGGFSREGEYLHGEDLSYEPDRKQKLEFKLRLAKDADYPLYVVSYEETKPLEKGETLTVLDGIISRVLYKRRERELITRYAEEERDEIAQMADDVADEYVQDLVLRAGVEAEIETDVFDSDRLKYTLQHMKLIDQPRVVHYEHPPAVSEVMDRSGSWDFDALWKRQEGLDKAVAHGTKIVLEMNGGPTVVRNVRIRAVGDWFSAHQLSEKIATYLALKQVASLVPPDRKAEFESVMGPQP